MKENISKGNRMKFFVCVMLFILITSTYILEFIDFNIKLILMIFLIFLSYYMVIEFKKVGVTIVCSFYAMGFVSVAIITRFAEYHLNAVLAFQVSIVISIFYLYKYVEKVEITRKKLYESTIIDDLTEIYNSRYYRIKVNEELARANRHNQKFAIMMIDFDDFKAINDTNGHIFGDEILKSFANELKTKIREEDTFCRLGGDEFILLTSNYSEQSILNINARIEDAVASINMIYHEELKDSFSVSTGFAVFPDDTSDLMDLMRHADNAMYKAKEV